MIKKRYVHIEVDGFSFMRNGSEIMFTKSMEWL